MTTVHIDLSQLSGIDPGTINLTRARIDFSPYTAFEVNAGEWLTRQILRCKLPTGVGSPEVPSTPIGNAYEIEEHGWRGARRGYVLVPDQSDVNYTDLIWVDPETLDPIGPLLPVWQTYIEDYVELAITELINGAPGALDTLKELADALGDDPNFAATVTTQLGLKATTTALSAETAARVQAIVDEVTARQGGDATNATAAAAAQSTANAAGSAAASAQSAANAAGTLAAAAEPKTALDHDTGVLVGTAASELAVAVAAKIAAAIDAVTASDIIATSTAGALTRGKWTRVDATAGTKAMTLANAATARQVTIVEKSDSSVNVVTIALGLRGSAGSLTLDSQFQTYVLVADDDLNWYVQSTHRTKASFDALYAPLPNRVASIPALSYWAHRLGAGYAPENSLEAARISTAAGADALECDIQPLADGAFGIFHDTTLDRVTNGTGNVSDITSPGFVNLTLDAPPFWGSKVVSPALLNQLVSEFAGGVILAIEPKDTSTATAIMNLLDKYGAKGSVIMESADTTIIAACKARGYTTYFYWATTITAPTPAAAIAAGADYLGSDAASATSSADIATLVATGKKVVPFGVDNRYDKARVQALGVVGFMSNNPVYIKATTAQRKSDSWRYGVLGHGFVGDLPISITNGMILYAGFVGSPIGELCPIANAAGTYTIDYDCGFTTLPTGSVFDNMTMAICMPDDRVRKFSSASTTGTAYIVQMRVDGNLTIGLTTEATGGATGNQTQATTALVAGTNVHIRIAVTPTTITVTRTDSGGFTPIVKTDATRRGAYISAVKGCATGIGGFQNVVITP